ncbi:MAG: hypothetical protein IKP62_02875 [Salinivirgaceae bacterium]|nr:hypothetical protein [Salinivirgaceae bacterium]
MMQRKEAIMLNPRSERVNYGQQLYAPEGYKLRNAICTTYSLDLETLLAAIIALGLDEETDSELRHSPLNGIHAIQTVAKKLVVFCEAGQIVAPKQSLILMALLEKMVVEMALKKKGNEKWYPSFHPKTWIVLYENVNNSKDKWCRFIVMSRNLTTDRSWDVSVMMEGPVTGKSYKIKNEPLTGFVSFLQTFVKDHRVENLRVLNDIKGNLPNVHFELDETFSEYEIIPLGYKGCYPMTEDSLWLDKPDGLIVVSPFLDQKAIAHWNDWHGTKMKLVTRDSELYKIRDCHDNIEVYTLKSQIVDGENNLPDMVDSDDRDIRKEDIHAKMYMWHKGSEKWLYLGSMNSTQRGMGVNCEMMLALYTKKGSVGFNKLWDDLAGSDEKECPYERVDWSKVTDTVAESDDNDALAPKIKDLCRCSLKAHVSNNDSKYNVTIKSKGKVPSNMTIASMLASKKAKPLSESDVTLLEGLDMLELSEFYIVTAYDDKHQLSKLIRIPTSPMPDEREKKIVSQYFNKPDDFALYIGLVLSGRETYAKTCLMNSLFNSKQAAASVETQMPALYEQLLRASVFNPEKIEQIADIIEKIEDDSIVTPEFRNTFAMFHKEKK